MPKILALCLLVLSLAHGQSQAQDGRDLVFLVEAEHPLEWHEFYFEDHHGKKLTSRLIAVYVTATHPGKYRFNFEEPGVYKWTQVQTPRPASLHIRYFIEVKNVKPTDYFAVSCPQQQAQVAGARDWKLLWLTRKKKKVNFTITLRVVLKSNGKYKIRYTLFKINPIPTPDDTTIPTRIGLQQLQNYFD